MSHELTQIASCSSLGLYIHVPFCASKCRYCGFYSEYLEEKKIAPVIEAMMREMKEYDLSAADTIYIGGGSPSAIPEEDLERLLKCIRIAALKRIGQDLEFTVEVNPSQVTEKKLWKLHEYGVNRLSIGAQSFDDGELEFLGRRHKAADVPGAVAAARKAGFANVSIDLIFAIPGQKIKSWKNTLEEAVRLGVEHISAYALTYEEGTPLCAARERGEVVAADEELDRAMYLAAIDTLAAAGYQQYEISNFARPGCKCGHNMRYWANDEYVGIGPAAASWYQGTRWMNVANIEQYLAAQQTKSEYRNPKSETISNNRNPNVRTEEEIPSFREIACETAVLNLRRLRGIELEEYKRRTGFDAMELFGDVIRKQEAAGMLKVEGGRIFLTREALPVADSVLCEFAGAE